MGGGKKSLKLHKYTLKLYKYAVLRVLDFYGEWGVDCEKICQVETKKMESHPDNCNFAP